MKKVLPAVFGVLALGLVVAGHYARPVAAAKAEPKDGAKASPPCAEFDVVKARQVQVVDAAGKSRVTVVGDKGGAGVYIGHVEGGPGLSLYTTAEGDAAICFYKNTGSGGGLPYAIVTSHAGKNGEAEFQVVDKKGKVRFISVRDLLPKDD